MHLRLGLQDLRLGLGMDLRSNDLGRPIGQLNPLSPVEDQLPLLGIQGAALRRLVLALRRLVLALLVRLSHRLREGQLGRHGRNEFSTRLLE